MLDGLTGPLTDKQLRYLTHIKAHSDRLARYSPSSSTSPRSKPGRLSCRPTILPLVALTTEVADSLRPVAAEKQISLAVVASRSRRDSVGGPG